MLTSEQAVDHATEAPHVTALVVGNLKENFRRDIWEGSKDAFALCILSQLDCIGELGDSGAIFCIFKKDVIRLYVSVNDRVVMKVLQAFRHIIGYSFCSKLTQWVTFPTLFDMLNESRACDVLAHDVLPALDFK